MAQPKTEIMIVQREFNVFNLPVIRRPRSRDPVPDADTSSEAQAFVALNESRPLIRGTIPKTEWWGKGAGDGI
jgi:hypothetical protein